MISKIVRRFWPLHPHIFILDDMAIGITTKQKTTPVTGWKSTCFLCKTIFIDITEFGVEQLQQGNNTSAVFQWMNDCSGSAGSYG